MHQPTPAAVEALQRSLQGDLAALLPECLLVGGIALLLGLRLFSSTARWRLTWLAFAVALGALAVAVAQSGGIFRIQRSAGAPDSLFTGLLRLDDHARFLRLILLGTLAIVLWLNLATGIPDREDDADYATLLLGSTLGLLVLVMSNHLMMLFLGVEMASVPGYVLAGFLKGRRTGSEAALKYVLYGATASGVMLYGISLLAIRFGSAGYLDLARGIDVLVTYRQIDLVSLAGVALVLVGFGFKLALVPFHFWLPDVFAGAPAEVAAFLSVAPKAAAVAALGRVLLYMTALLPVTGGTQFSILLGVCLAVCAVATMTLGNLAALGQTNLKRLLGYSTVAHAGYLMLGVATLSVTGYAAVLVYLIAYLAMNLGAFAVVALLRNRVRSEEVADLRGAVHHSPVLVVSLAVFLLSLLGVPPLMGFAGKFGVFAAYFEAIQRVSAELPLLRGLLALLLLLAAVNTVVSAGYYLHLLRVTVLDAPPADGPAPGPEPWGARLLVGLLALLVVLGGVFWGPIREAAAIAARGMIQ